MSVDILRTSWDQCRSMVQYSFTSTETRLYTAGLYATGGQSRIIGRSCHKYNFCRYKTFVTTSIYFCRDNAFVTTSILLSRQNTCSSRQIFVAINVLSRQTHVCHDKHKFVATNVLSWQACFCRGKRRVLSRETRQHFCHNKNYTFGSSRQW